MEALKVEQPGKIDWYHYKVEGFDIFMQPTKIATFDATLTPAQIINLAALNIVLNMNHYKRDFKLCRIYLIIRRFGQKNEILIFDNVTIHQRKQKNGRQ